MTTSVSCNPYENDDHTHLLDNYHYLTDRRCLKQLSNHIPLALKRSVSLEDSSTDPENNLIKTLNEQCSTNLLPAHNPQLSNSLNTLCFKLRRYQLLPDYNEDMAKAVDQNDFNWWKKAAHLRPLLERIVATQNRKFNHAPETYQNDELIKFKNCKRYGRRNAVCLGIDRLYYNDQLMLFATIANEVEFEFNLMSAGYRL